jgi:ABC-type amino acid transport substrate-binding protein
VGFGPTPFRPISASHDTLFSRILAAVILGGLATGPLAATPALDRIKSTGTIAFAYRAGAAPFSFKGRNDAPQGYSVELCEKVAAAIARSLGIANLRIDWRPVDAATRIDAVANGQADAECGTSTITLSRRERVDFSVPIFVDGGSVLVRAKDHYARIADLAGKRIGVIPGTTTDTALSRALKVADVKAERVPVKDGAEGVAALQAGTLDAYASDRVVLAGLKMADAHGDALALINQDFSYEPYALILRRDDPDFRLAVDRALVGLYKSGDIDAIFVKWLAPLGAPSPLLNAMFYLNSLPE